MVLFLVISFSFFVQIYFSIIRGWRETKFTRSCGFWLACFTTLNRQGVVSFSPFSIYSSL